MIVKKTLPPYHGRDLDRMIYKKTYILTKGWSSCQATENIVGFKENRLIVKENSFPDPDSTGVNRQLCSIPGQIWDILKNRTKRKEICHPTRLKEKLNYFGKNRLIQKIIISLFRETICIHMFWRRSLVLAFGSMSNNCAGFDSQESKKSEELRVLNKYTTTLIGIN